MTRGLPEKGLRARPVLARVTPRLEMARGLPENGLRALSAPGIVWAC
jgi:hypothetical protein